MWRLGVLLVAVSFAFVAADVKPTNGDLIQRLKRSPYECQDFQQYPPPPPPPPYWHRHHRHRFPPPRFDAYSEANAGSFGPGAGPFGPGSGPFGPGAGFNLPCANNNCSGNSNNGESSVSNAKSETGDAIAVAIAKASPKPK